MASDKDSLDEGPEPAPAAAAQSARVDTAQPTAEPSAAADAIGKVADAIPSALMDETAPFIFPVDFPVDDPAPPKLADSEDIQRADREILSVVPLAEEPIGGTAAAPTALMGDEVPPVDPPEAPASADRELSKTTPLDEEVSEAIAVADGGAPVPVPALDGKPANGVPAHSIPERAPLLERMGVQQNLEVPATASEVAATPEPAQAIDDIVDSNITSTDVPLAAHVVALDPDQTPEASEWVVPAVAAVAAMSGVSRAEVPAEPRPATRAPANPAASYDLRDYPAAERELALERSHSIDRPVGTVRHSRHWAARAGLFAAQAAAAYLGLILSLILLFRVFDPPGSALMALRWIGGAEIQQTWVPIKTISPHLVRAVIVSEDGSFCTHNGIDIDAMQQAFERAGNGIPRGASTISMQVTKNMFLWPSKSYLRKAIEVPFTLLMEVIWPKHRILEVYLNVAEWGPGIFGAEAASQHHFQKPASSLTAREAAQLAASLPNPFRRDAGDPGPQTSRKAGVIQARMRIAGPTANCVLPSTREAAAKERRN